MKSDKSPGIDSFPVEFFNISLERIKSVVLHALNKGYKMGQMSETLKCPVITGIPKGMQRTFNACRFGKGFRFSILELFV